MTESIEQAALRRAQRAELPAPFGSILDAIEAAEQLNQARYRHVDALASEIVRLHEHLADQGDAIVALSNRIEALTRAAKARDAA